MTPMLFSFAYLQFWIYAGLFIFVGFLLHALLNAISDKLNCDYACYKEQERIADSLAVLAKANVISVQKQVNDSASSSTKPNYSPVFNANSTRTHESPAAEPAAKTDYTPTSDFGPSAEPVEAAAPAFQQNDNEAAAQPEVGSASEVSNGIRVPRPFVPKISTNPQKTCPNCKQSIPTSSERCPYCGSLVINKKNL